MYYAYCMCIVVCVSVGKYRIVGSWLLYGVATSTLFVVARIRAQRVDAWRYLFRVLRDSLVHVCILGKYQVLRVLCKTRFLLLSKLVLVVCTQYVLHMLETSIARHQLAGHGFWLRQKEYSLLPHTRASSRRYHIR
jgi:hypothetical protein